MKTWLAMKMCRGWFQAHLQIRKEWVYPKAEEKWYNHQPLYEVNIYSISKPGSPYYGWDEGRNTQVQA